jgi:hypothetical protein
MTSMPLHVIIRCALLPLLFALPVFAAPAMAQARVQRDGARADSAAVADSADIAVQTQAIIAGAATDSARAAAIYEWVANNVAYDVDGYLAGRIDGETAEQVFRRRIAVCGGFVALYNRMAAEAGLRVEPITGYAKGFDHYEGRSSRRNNHAWLAIHLDGRWRLVDPTWGAGAVRDGRFEAAFDWYYFLVSPEELILSHYPRQRQWQLTARTMSRNDFERLPAVPRALFSVGFEPAALRTALASHVRDFPTVAPEPGLRVVVAPIAGTLRSGNTVSVEVVWRGADVALVNGGVWTHLSRSGDRFTGQAHVAPGELWVVGKDTAGTPYRTLLHYRVH